MPDCLSTSKKLNIIKAAQAGCINKGNYPMNIIGLDVSKDTIDAYLDPTNGNPAHIKITNDPTGYMQLQDWIKSRRLRKVIVCMEATGIYYEKSADWLSRYHTVYVINPLKIKEYGRTLFNHTKTDRADAKLIADYGKRYMDKLIQFENPTNDNRRLQKLIALGQQLKQQLKQAKNRLHASTDDYIANTHEAIICLLDHQITQTANQIDAIIKQQNDLNQHYQNLKSIPSVGKETAVMLLRHLSSKQFQTANHFVSFAGLSPKIEQSGTSVNRKGGNRYGHKKLKAALFMPALVAFRMTAFPQLIKNLQAANKPKMVIIVAIMRKLAKLAYYIYKTSQPYDKSRHQAA